MIADTGNSQETTQPADILFISSGLWHPNLLARRQLAQALSRNPLLNFQFASSLEALPRLDLSAIQALVLYIHQRSISPPALRALVAYAAGGGGVLALHSAAASFKTQSQYVEILGGRFINHGPVTHFEVLPVSQPGALCADLPRFWVHDELYRHEYDPAVTVHLYTDVAGEGEPVMWTHSYGKGRIGYCSLGHTASVFRQPQALQALRRCLNWVAGVIDVETSA